MPCNHITLHQEHRCIFDSNALQIPSRLHVRNKEAVPTQAEDFFAPLPQAIITCLRSAPCIATESGTWILPAEAVISHAGTDAARGLLAHAISLGIPSVNYVHPALTALHCTSALRLHLGIKLLDTDHLLGLLKTAAQQGMLPELGPHWCSRMLACIFDMLATKEPHIRSLRAQDIKLSPAAQSLIQDLTAVPMFPVTPGKWVAAGKLCASQFQQPDTAIAASHQCAGSCAACDICCAALRISCCPRAACTPLYVLQLYGTQMM